MANKHRRHLTPTDMVLIEKQVNRARQKDLNPASVPQNSVVVQPKASEGRSLGARLLIQIASAADTMTPWGLDVMGRDKQLRSFYPTEPILSSAVYNTTIRNASFPWEVASIDPLRSAKNTRRAVTRLLNAADRGGGWNRLMIKTCTDLYTQDNGAFWELLREQNSPDSPVLNIAHLDAARCHRTGDPQIPVIYEDEQGRLHNMAWYNIVTLEEMPSPVETLYGSQMCAVSRCLRAAQILRSILIYKDEKVSGRNLRAIDFVSGVTQSEIDDAMAYEQEKANNLSLARYVSHAIIAGVDPSNPVTTERLELSSLPDNFSFDDEMRWYLAILAMAFGVDYQEFAPLPGARMGSGQEGEILHMKTRGKGPAAIMSLIEHTINDNGLIPSNVKFQFVTADTLAEEQKANARFTRGKDRALRVDSGELDPVSARYMAVEDGDLPEWIAEDMETRGAESTPAVDVSPPPEQGGRISRKPFTNEQVTGGIDSHSQTKERMGSRGGMRSIIKDSDLPEISDEEIAAQRQIMRRSLNA